MLNTSTPKLRVNDFIQDSIVDGYGLRFVVFTQGCPLRCVGCHNPGTHDLEGGHLIELSEIRKEWKKNPLLTGITISGGEPFIQKDAVYELIKLAKADGLDVNIYSGFTYDALKKKEDTTIDLILESADILIDGPFVIGLKNLNLLWRGSENQRVIDLKETKRLGRVVEIKD
ncbi:Pyruvate formate-lyase 1-activating enzyme [Acholeplasma oculi]|uniref:Anaerobic ribonucleoside-triphosphate reductase-activating protein n=1 Tax=Acholeplasma oculi TaxID=35623 RepID=A0A061AGV7_9MOLU|nr:anaerobic ribonucleoside-triphosphate reductase activating protein [Acholeplasma oculi]CDR30182.1 Ribonucleoside-triphosphate reductase activating, anaerobic [Acholeplasma oculi]SKC44154.1 anaerobic ribonucleoside-triphosphate reductase activating protein [Acholeplasma oculi]SUT88532.1 Pyruvate formate-lyase 1-activating enzyme [Acholeplasma oculi]